MMPWLCNWLLEKQQQIAVNGCRVLQEVCREGLCWNDKGLVLLRTRQGSAGGEEALRAAKQQMNQCGTEHRAAHRHHSPGVLCTGDVLLCSQPRLSQLCPSGPGCTQKGKAKQNTRVQSWCPGHCSTRAHTGLEGSSPPKEG